LQKTIRVDKRNSKHNFGHFHCVFRNNMVYFLPLACFVVVQIFILISQMKPPFLVWLFALSIPLWSSLEESSIVLESSIEESSTGE
jgi:hypothetical protein